MSRESALLPMELPQMSSRGGSRAKISAVPAQRPEFLVKDRDYGGKCADSFTVYDLNTQSWRTYQTCFIEGLAMFSETWPRSGMTRNGTAYRLPSLDCRRPGSAYGLLPTLVGADGQGARNGTVAGRSLSSGMTMTDWVWVNLGRGMLDPGSAERMMGFQIGHTELKPSETPSSRKFRKSSGGRSLPPKEE